MDDIPWFKKLATLIESHPKASFSIATTLGCREGRYSIPMDYSTLPLILTL